jgi:SagB-type dehydrogenase family enzyme
LHNMSSFLSRLHADLRQTLLTRRGATHAPDDVPKGLHKEYPRMAQIPLPEPAVLASSLESALERRHSTNTSETGIPLTLQDTASLFGPALRRHTNDIRRNYPSGGALYPVETYLIATLFEGAAPGIFHYHPTAHALERLWNLPAAFEMKQIVRHPDTLNPSALIVFTSVWSRSSAKYGDLAYQHALIEAGHMSQNILLLSSALGLETRPYAGFNDERIIELLDIDAGAEQPVHSITLSKLKK